MAYRKINNNVSTSAISRLEKVIISKLCVVSDFDAKIVKGSRANTKFCTPIVWRYFGALQQSIADGKQSSILLVRMFLASHLVYAPTFIVGVTIAMLQAS